MCDDWSFERSVKHLALSHLLQTLGKIVALTVDPSRNFDECHKLLVEFVGRKTQTIDSLNEDINTLVAPLVASACRDNDSIIGYFVACEGACDVEQTLACSLALAVESLALRYEVVLKSVRQNHINRLVEQFGTFTCCNFAYCSKTIYVGSCLLLDRLLALHIKLLGHLVAVVSFKIFIKWLVVACDASSDACSMCSKDCGNLRQTVVDI